MAGKVRCFLINIFKKSPGRHPKIPTGKVGGGRETFFAFNFQLSKSPGRHPKIPTGKVGGGRETH